MIVGGIGHTTQFLQNVLHRSYPRIVTEKRPEADIMSEYIRMKYGIGDILIENRSTNCGNNITFALEKLKEKHIYPGSIVIVQDAAMQCRMDAGFRKYADSNTLIINYAAYKVQFTVKNGKLTLSPSDIWGMWTPEQYSTLLMGEIPRLRDDENGYGPLGKNFIAHVELPRKVLHAFDTLKNDFGAEIRTANSVYKG